jgi:hypothetical protein
MDPTEIGELRGTYLRSRRPSDVLRAIMQGHPNFGPIDLMKYMATIFELEHDDVSCINGWWVDGTGELDDAAIDRLLVRSIERVGPKWARHD